MQRTIPPPSIHETNGQTGLKGLVDVLAEVDDWFAKEVSSSDPWAMPTELLNLEQKREILKIAVKHGVGEALLLALVTPFIVAVAGGDLVPFSNFGAWGNILALAVLGWPYLVLPFLPLLFVQKIRGNITRFICQELTLARGLALVGASWALSVAFIYSPWIISFLLSSDAHWSIHISAALRQASSLLQDSYFWLATGGLFSAAVPFATAIFVAMKVQRKWDETQVLIRGIQ